MADSTMTRYYGGGRHHWMAPYSAAEVHRAVRDKIDGHQSAMEELASGLEDGAPVDPTINMHQDLRNHFESFSVLLRRLDPETTLYLTVDDIEYLGITA